MNLCFGNISGTFHVRPKKSQNLHMRWVWILNTDDSSKRRGIVETRAVYLQSVTEREPVCLKMPWGDRKGLMTRI